ncbi:MAG: prepilin-type N-terminal cleavage/methylation domain-containing protein [Phycisphaerales bacterium]|nr:prepilin-type N-terminal cleavage/methylation domain-containing protein [Phycisphaerales bacterium]
MRNRVRKAFTLVEILIVVVILGILAAIVIPQFTNASQDAQRGNVVTQMQSLRNQIELFRVRNGGRNPVIDGVDNAAFSDLTATTNSFGRQQEQYLRAAASNPRNNTSTVVLTANTGDALRTEAASTDPQAAGAAGWLYNNTTGEFIAVGYSEFSDTWFGSTNPPHLTARP